MRAEDTPRIGTLSQTVLATPASIDQHQTLLGNLVGGAHELRGLGAENEGVGGRVEI